jgi:hypothetical protein
MIKKFNSLIKNIDISKISYKQENIWPIFRNKIGWNMIIREYSSGMLSNRKRAHKLNIIKIFFSDIFKLLFYIGKYDYIYFTTSDDYRVVGNENINRLTHEFSSNVKDAKVLEIQSTLSLQKNRELSNINYLSNTFIIIFRLIVSRFIMVESVDNIIKEFEKNSIHIDAQKIIREYLAYKILYELLFKITKPKMVISTCYTSMFAIKSANDLGIKTLEFQHGKISEHYAYTINEDINSSFYPKYIAVFGDEDRVYLNNSNYISYKKNIFLVGNMLVSYYRNKESKEIRSLRYSYSKIIAITLQWTVFEEVVEYIKKESKLNKKFCFILIPRKKEELLSYTYDGDNIKIFPDLTCYEIVANADYHFTVYSTCANEAPSLGIKNIFYNIKNLSNLYFDDYIKSNKFNLLLEPGQHISDIISTDSPDSKESIIHENREIIYPNYRDNIKQMVEDLK